MPPTLTTAPLAAAVEYCHLRGVKVYLTLNTLLNDRELPLAAALVNRANRLGIDALLVQDLGVARMARQVAPDLPLHASTQMTIHSLDGAKAAADLGMTRWWSAGSCPGIRSPSSAPTPPWRSSALSTAPCACATQVVLLLLRHRRQKRQPGHVRSALPAQLRLGLGG